ncbi:hypothetical protein JCM11491_003201 [Sporobolomyces phaffii]
MNYSYANHDAIADLVRTKRAGVDYQVVDVRDQDFRGGNIPGAIRAPSEQRTDDTVRALVERLDGIPTVVFHCTLSQVRGPKNARIYAEAVAARAAGAEAAASVRSNDEDPSASSTSTTTTTTTTTTTSSRPGAASSDQAFSGPNPFPNPQGRQQVLVLRDGFSNWQGLYRDDPQLVENFDARIWKDFSP